MSVIRVHNVKFPNKKKEEIEGVFDMDSLLLTAFSRMFWHKDENLNLRGCKMWRIHMWGCLTSASVVGH